MSGERLVPPDDLLRGARRGEGPPDSRGDVIPALPRRLHLEITNRCNSLCTTCVRTREPEPDWDLGRADLERLLAELPDLESVALQVNGEPLLYRDLPWLVGRLVARGVRVELNTNAVTLAGDLARALIDSGLGQLNVSLDGATAPTYARIRGVDAFERVVRNVTGFLGLRGAAPARPRLVLWITLSKHNLAELEALVDLAISLGVDGLYLQRLVFFDYGLARDEDSLHGRLSPAETAAIARATSKARAAGLEVSASGGHAPDAMLAPLENPEPFRACRRPSESAVVMANGDVVPCCISTFVAPREAITMGNVLRQSLADVWSGARYQAFRAALRHGVAPQSCTRCGVCWSL